MSDPSAEDPIPHVGEPAARALAAEGITSLAQLSSWTEAQLLALHGVGPKAVRIWKEHLAQSGRSLAPKAPRNAASKTKPG